MLNTLEWWVNKYKFRSNARREVYCRAAVFQWIHENLMLGRSKNWLTVKSTRIPEGLFFSIIINTKEYIHQYTARWDDDMSPEQFENVLKTTHMLVTGT